MEYHGRFARLVWLFAGSGLLVSLTVCAVRVPAGPRGARTGAGASGAGPGLKSPPPGLAREIARIEAEIDQTFAKTLAQASRIPDGPRYNLQRIRTLGKLLLFDRRLSVNQNTACVFCHMPSTGYTGPISELNRTYVTYPGSVRTPDGSPATSRYGPRKPQAYVYSPYSPVLHLNRAEGELYGGNFWDMRASGWKLQNPSAQQAQGPMVDAAEHGFSDSACVVYRISQGPYRSLFEKVWGPQAFDIRWPADIEAVCRRPAPPSSSDPLPVHLSPEDRGRANATYDQFGLSVAANEAGPDASPFSSKFDYAVAHPTRRVLTRDELAGWELFRTKGRCNTCHVDGTAAIRGPITPAKAANRTPLFSDFSSSNLGLPKNLAIPFYYETRPDRYGFVVNPAGSAYVDRGVGGFLRGTLDPSAEWASLAPQFDGKFQVPTLRNVDMRPRPDFVKAYMHNGYLKSLKEVVHFYNTRDRIPHRQPGLPGEKVTYWPPPEVTANEDRTIGNLGLTGREEDQIVAFMRTLTDGYVPPKAR